MCVKKIANHRAEAAAPQLRRIIHKLDLHQSTLSHKEREPLMMPHPPPHMAEAAAPQGKALLGIVWYCMGAPQG